MKKVLISGPFRYRLPIIYSAYRHQLTTFTLYCGLKQQLDVSYSSSYQPLTRDLREYDFMVIFGFKLIEHVGNSAIGIDKEA